MYPILQKLLYKLTFGLSAAPLKYIGAAVVLQEVPDEISLAISITGCRRNCHGCHSPHLRKYTGIDLAPDLEKLIKEHPGITCVCFMGGDQNLNELKYHVKRIRKKHPELKICLYTGESSANALAEYIAALSPNYIKMGAYIESLGPLSSPTTNQRMYKISYPYSYTCPSYRLLHDITAKFQRNIDAEITQEAT